MMNIAANAYQENDSLLAGDESLTKNLVIQSAKIYANQSIPTTVGGWDNSDNLKRGEFTPFIKGDFSHLCKNFDDNHFTFLLTFGYSEKALAKSSVRIETLNLVKATHDAPSVFFCVNAYAHLLNAVLYRPNSMVMLAGQPKGWLVSFTTSSLNPVSVTTPLEIETSGGDSYDNVKEIIIMMAIPTQTQFKFLWRFFSCQQSKYFSVEASNEEEARSMLPDSPCLFSARIRQEVAYA
ncbi:host cell division inhibitor Icd-like protein [Providencia rettgeri]